MVVAGPPGRAGARSCEHGGMASSDTRPLVLLAQALDQAAAAVRGGADEPAAPTPCRSWTVRDLVEHVVFGLEKFTTAARGGRPDWQASPPALEGDWVAAFRRGADGLLAAWRAAGDLSAPVTLPVGEVPASFQVYQQITELAVHTWDLVRATGQALKLDPEVAGAALDWAKTAMRPEFRGDETSGKSFGPEVAVPADAPVDDRLAGFFGREPAAWRMQ
jgi:uncharacterized protein (TIGR03086 family)